MIDTSAVRANHTRLSRQQITGFWGAWAGWTLDGMDSVIYALVLSPALTELLPKSGFKATPANVGFAGSILFALFLVGWGLSFIWGPIADMFGRTRVLAATIFVYAIFTGAAALSQTVWQLGLFRMLAGIGIGGEWALAGTYVAEAWPEDRRKMGAGYLQTGYYAGFFLASALNYTVEARYGWRAMFWCGLTPVVVVFFILFLVKEPARWQQKAAVKSDGGFSSLHTIFRPPYTQRTLVNTILVASAICGLWAGFSLCAHRNHQPGETLRHVAGAGRAYFFLRHGTAVAGDHPRMPGRSAIGRTLWPQANPGALLPRDGGLHPAQLWLGRSTCPRDFIRSSRCSSSSEFFGGNFAVFSLWLPEQYGTTVRATAFAFTTSFGRFIAAGVNFAVGAMVSRMGTLGKPVAFTAIAFGIGLLVIPFAVETRGKVLPD